MMMAGGYLGGYLSMTKGVGPAQTVFDPGPTEWTPAADASVLAEGRPLRAVVDDTPPITALRVVSTTIEPDSSRERT